MKVLYAWVTGISCVLTSFASSATQVPSKLEYDAAYSIAYYDAAAQARGDEYQNERCKLDIYYPKNARGFATVVWFHGGGLTAGARYFPPLKEQGVALVAVSHRLAPKAQTPSFLQDSAAAVAWVLRNIERYGGDPRKVFVAGHSSGAYLASMIVMDPKWLQAHGLSHRQLAGLMAVSGQMTTHPTIRKLRGERGSRLRPVIDEYAPLHYVAKDLPPICLIVGGRTMEIEARVEENLLMAATLRALGHSKVEFYEMEWLDHDTVEKGAMFVMLGFLHRVLQPSP